MDTSFKTRSFKFVYWIMLILLVGDTLDTIYRTVSGYLGDGSSFPGIDFVFQPTSTDMIAFIIIQLGVIYGIYLLYKLKKVGGYWVLGANLLGRIFGFTVGPLSGHLSEVLPFFVIYFIIMIIVVIGIPRFYSEKFD